MLMATYQPIASLKHVKGLEEAYREFAENAQSRMPDELDKVWCFPASTWKEAFLHSLLTAPNCPQAFMLLDTDDYRRIDKVKHYTGIARQEGNSKESHDELINRCEDAGCPDDCSELIIAPVELGNAKAVYVFHPEALDGNGEGHLLIRNGNGFQRVGLTNFPFPLSLRIRMIQRMLNVDAAIGADGDEMAGIPEKLRFEASRLAFMFNWLALLYEIAGETPDELTDRGIALMDCNKWAMDCYNRMGTWFRGECDRDTYLSIVADAKLPLTLPDGFDLLLKRHDMPGRNDPCVCGSGKKFKKCHAKIF